MTDPSFERWFSKSAHQRWAAGLLLGIVLLCVYYPVVHSNYLYHDDWQFFADRASSVRSGIDDWSRIGGRPLEQYVLRSLFGMFETVDGAWVARLAIVGGIAIFAFLQSIYFQALGIRWLAALSLSLGTSVLPGMLVYGYWITAGSIVSALVASVAAALFTNAALTPGKGPARRSLLIAGACAFQAIALLIYQTDAMYFWTLSAVMLATLAPGGLRAAVRPLAAYALVGAAPMAAYFIWFRYFSGLAPVLAAADPSRGTMFPNAAATAKWFFGSVLPHASLLWFFDLPHEFGWVVLLACLSVLILLSARLWLTTRRKNDPAGSLLSLAYPFVILVLAIGAFFPMLVTNYYQQVFRSLVPLSALIFLTGTIHLGAALRTERWPPVVKTCLAAGFVIGLSWLASHSLTHRMVVPAVAEYSFVRDSVRQALQRGPRPDWVHVVAAKQRPKYDTDEIDNLLTQDLEPMLQAIGHDLGVHLGPMDFSLPGEPFDRDGALVVDLAELSKRGLWKAAPPESAIPLWTYGNGYRLVVCRDVVYALPRDASPVTWERETLSTSRGVVTGSTVREVISHFPSEAALDRQPILLRAYGSYNLVGYRGHIYGLPQALGPVNWEGGMVGRLPGVVTGATISDVISQLPRSTGMNLQPQLLRSHHTYNLVAYRDRIYGVPQSLGQVDWEGGQVGNLPGVVTGSTVEEVLARLPR